MSATKTKLRLYFTTTLELNEAEVRALDGIFGYNVDAFLRVFYERMGESYVRPYEAGVRSLHERLRGVLAGPIAEMDEVRKRLKQAHE